MNTTTVSTVEYHQMPDNANRTDLTGMSIRQCLAALRAESWGDMGGATIELSDGTTINVELEPTSGNSWLMSSQRAVRVHYVCGAPRVLRTYAIR